jgi:outer membrane receptor protein involved in Fe transport
MDAYGIIDLSASLSNDRWTARLYVRNLADERAYVSPTRVSPTVFESAVTRPRTIGVSIDFAY